MGEPETRQAACLHTLMGHSPALNCGQRKKPGLEIVTYCTIAPSITATTVPDTFSQYAEDIATGVLMRLMKSTGKDYSDINGALMAKADWDASIDDAKSDADRGFSRSTARTAKVWF